MYGIQFPTDPMKDQFLSSVCVCVSVCVCGWVRERERVRAYMCAKPSNHRYWQPAHNQPAAPEAVEGRDFESAPAICVPGGVFVVITNYNGHPTTYHHEPATFWELLGSIGLRRLENPTVDAAWSHHRQFCSDILWFWFGFTNLELKRVTLKLKSALYQVYVLGVPPLKIINGWSGKAQTSLL